MKLQDKLDSFLYEFDQLAMYILNANELYKRTIEMFDIKIGQLILP